MKRFKGTQGKWIAKDASPEIGFDIIDYPRGDIVAKIRYELIKEIGYYGLDAENEDKAIANKDLIATAPELLRSLRNSYEIIEWLLRNGNFDILHGSAFNMATNQLKESEKTINKALGHDNNNQNSTTNS